MHKSALERIAIEYGQRSAASALKNKYVQRHRNSKGTRIAFTTSVAAFPLILLFSVAKAQTGNDETEVIIITGTKRGLTVQEAEVSVEVFDSARLDRESLFDLDDVLLRTPNVSTNGSTAAFSIRGISRTGAGGGQGVTSNVYLDGAPITQFALTYGFDSVWDLGQIEILRGPQSTVQGRNALAGSVVLRTNDPTYDWEGAARARYAEFGTLQTAGVVSGPIIDNQLAFRLAVDHQTTDGFARNGFTGVDYNARNNVLVRGKLLIEPSTLDKLRSVFIVDYNNGESGPQSTRIFSNVSIGEPGYGAFDYTDFRSFIPQEITDVETIRVVSDSTYDLTSNLTLHSILTYEDNKYLRQLGDPDNPGQLDTSVNEDVLNDGDAQTTTAELRLTYDFDRWSGSIGAYYFNEVYELDTIFFSSLEREVFFPIDPVDSLLVGGNFTREETDNYALYIQTRFEPSDQWTFDFGLRYDFEEYATTGTVSGELGVLPTSCVGTISDSVRDFLGLDTNMPTCIDIVRAATPTEAVPPIQANEFDAFLPRGTVTYHFNNDVSIFLSAQRGYRAGGAYLPDRITPVFATYEPEFLTTYEAGFRSVWFDDRLTVNGNIFFGEYTDQQVFIRGLSGDSEFFDDADPNTINPNQIIDIIENAGESEIMGAELTLDYTASDAVEIYASLGLLDTEFKDFEYANEGEFNNLDGNEFSLSPNISLSLGVSYEHVSGFFANGSLSYSGSQESQIFNLNEDDFSSFGPSFTERVGDRTTVNGRIGYGNDLYSMYLYGTNIFDEDAPLDRLLATVERTDSRVVPRAAPIQNVLAPRAFGIGIDLNF